MNGILATMAQQAPQNSVTKNGEQQAQQTAQQPGQNMAQMYQMLMENSMNAIADVAEQRMQEKGPIDGAVELVATAMIANLQAAQQNGKTIPPQLMIQVAKDLTMALLKQFGAPEDRIDDLLIDILLSAVEQFGEMSNGLISEDEEQQYIAMVEQISAAVAQPQ